MNRHDGDWYHPDDKGPPRAGFFMPACKRFKGGGKVKETPEQQELAAIAAEQYAIYEQDFIPLENKLIERVQDTGTERLLGLGAANLESSRAFGTAKNRLEATQTNSGARIGSGRFNLGAAEMALDQGQSAAASAVDVNQSVDDRKLAGLSALASIGRGQSSEALAGLSNVASQAASQASADAQYSAANRAAGLGALGSAAGFAAGSLGSRGGGATVAGGAKPGQLNAGGTFTVSPYEGL